LSENPLVISDVIHESVVTIDEDGVKAAAASAVMMVGSAAPGKAKPRIISFVVDHPFAFVISHRDSGAPLFMGVVSDPGA
jgi:serpin B